MISNQERARRHELMAVALRAEGLFDAANAQANAAHAARNGYLPPVEDLAKDKSKQKQMTMFFGLNGR